MNVRKAVLGVVEVLGLGLTFIFPAIGILLALVAAILIFLPNKWSPKLLREDERIIANNLVTTAVIEIENGGFNILQSKNIASLVDEARGIFTLVFLDPVTDEYTISASSDRAIDWEAVHRFPNKCTTKISGTEPNILRVSLA